LDGYRAVAVKSGGAVTLHSRNKKILNKRFPYLVEPLRGLPDGTVVDGEIVALDDEGRPVFNLLQNFTGESARIRYFVFDLLCYDSRDLTGLPLLKRREMLRSHIKFDHERVKISEFVEASGEQMLSAVREQRLEGIVGKLKDSAYEPGKRSGVWVKHRVNFGQEFVVGGFTPGPHGLDAIIVGVVRQNFSRDQKRDGSWYRKPEYDLASTQREDFGEQEPVCAGSATKSNLQLCWIFAGYLGFCWFACAPRLPS
jgi:ATP-dependent DNA ligase